jgi:hypothetical protein
MQHCNISIYCFHLSILITVQRDATQNSLFIILQVHSTCFGCQPHPSSGVYKIVTTASGTGHIFCAATSLQRGQAWPCYNRSAMHGPINIKFYLSIYRYDAYVSKHGTMSDILSVQQCCSKF